MKAGGHKLAYIAACAGLDESYICLLRSGKRRIREPLIEPLCAATGSYLLRQVWEALEAMNEQDSARTIERLAQQLRAA